MSHKKFGPDRFSRFDVYWIQTNKQTDRQTDKPNLYKMYLMYEQVDQREKENPLLLISPFELRIQNKHSQYFATTCKY